MIRIRYLANERVYAVGASVDEAVGTEGEAWGGSIATRGAALPSMTLRSTSTTTATAASSRLSRSRAPGYGLFTPSLRSQATVPTGGSSPAGTTATNPLRLASRTTVSRVAR